MNAQVECSGNTVWINGPSLLRGATVRGHDIRTCASLLLLALAAGGETVIDEWWHLRRGYHDLPGKLRSLGARIIEKGKQLKAGAEKTKTLLIWPPAASMYDNLCYHYCAFGEVAGYLDRLTRLEVIDAAVASFTYNDVALRILEFRPDFIFFYHDFDILPWVPPLVNLIRAVSDARIFTYGPPGMYTQRPFLEMGIDGVVFDGDWEYALGSCLEEPDCPRGVVTRSSQLEGRRLPSSEWGFPPLEKLPVEHYKAWGRVPKPNSERAGLMGLSEFSLTTDTRLRASLPFLQNARHRRRRTSEKGPRRGRGFYCRRDGPVWIRLLLGLQPEFHHGPGLCGRLCTRDEAPGHCVEVRYFP